MKILTMIAVVVAAASTLACARCSSQFHMRLPRPPHGWRSVNPGVNWANYYAEYMTANSPAGSIAYASGCNSIVVLPAQAVPTYQPIINTCSPHAAYVPQVQPGVPVYVSTTTVPQPTIIAPMVGATTANHVVTVPTTVVVEPSRTLIGVNVLGVEVGIGF